MESIHAEGKEMMQYWAEGVIELRGRVSADCIRGSGTKMVHWR